MALWSLPSFSQLLKLSLRATSPQAGSEACLSARQAISKSPDGKHKLGKEFPQFVLKKYSVLSKPVGSLSTLRYCLFILVLRKSDPENWRKSSNGLPVVMGELSGVHVSLRANKVSEAISFFEIASSSSRPFVERAGLLLAMTCLCYTPC